MQNILSLKSRDKLFCINLRLLSFPIPIVVVAHSPTPSAVKIIASLKGEG